MDKKTYKKYATAHAPKSPILKNCVFAFLIGGIICTLGEALNRLFIDVLEFETADGRTLTAVCLIFISVVLTGLGLFNDIAKVAGGGTLVPITGFANAVVSPAIDSKSEGIILGVGTKIFTVAGPVLLFSTLSGVIYGLVYYFVSML